MKCVKQVPMCRQKMMPCDHVGSEDGCPYHKTGYGDTTGNVPTLGTLISLYMEMCGPTLTEHQRNVMNEIKKLMKFAGLSGDMPSDLVTFDIIDRYAQSENVKAISRIGKCQRIQSLFGRKARMFYRRRGYDVTGVDVPVIADDSKAYQSLPQKTLFSLLGWYRSLQFRKDGRGRIFVMLMLKYAMRNGDVERLKWSNFDRSGATWKLTYTPHKTEHSTAGRSVSIWLDAMDQIELEEWRGDAGDDDYVVPRKARKHGWSIAELQRVLNEDIRKACGFTGSKGLYELRKLCVDTVFHLYGAEAAAAYSGDDYKTVKFHYSDPSSLNLRGISDNAFTLTATGFYRKAA